MCVADLYTGFLFLADLLNSLQGDCSIRMTALLEYLDLALAAPSWILCYNSVALSLILQGGYKGTSRYQLWLEYDKQAKSYERLFTKNNTNMLSRLQGKLRMGRS